VTVSYRGQSFEKKKLNSRYHLEISILTSKQKIGFLPELTLKEIKPDSVILNGPEGIFEHQCDFVLVQAGYEPDLSLMKMGGVNLTGPEQLPELNPETMETNVPGLFLAGTASGGGKASYKIFVATSHHHGAAITRRITGQNGVYSGSIAARSYSFDNADIAPTEGNSDDVSSPAEPLPRSISG
jgi:thioredoxin reductase (NADPH)